MQSYTESIATITAHLSVIRRELAREIAGKRERAHRYDRYRAYLSPQETTEEDALKEAQEKLEGRLHTVDTALAALSTWEE